MYEDTCLLIYVIVIGIFCFLVYGAAEKRGKSGVLYVILMFIPFGWIFVLIMLFSKPIGKQTLIATCNTCNYRFSFHESETYITCPNCGRDGAVK